MGGKQVKFCTDPSFNQAHDARYDDGITEYGVDNQSQKLKINEFQLCKKGEIHQEKIEIQMKIQSQIPDDEFLEDCDSLIFQVEIGELHERDKFQWIEKISQLRKLDQDENGEDIFYKKIKSLDFEFKMNHIKQVIKVEIIACYSKEQRKNEIFCGFYNFSRCIRKSGYFIQANQIGHAQFEDIKVQVSLQEKLKYGGYRCITLRIHDTKGGDFVENPDLTMIICEASKQIPLAEVSKEIPLLTSPEGLYKRIDIGVNNYNPSIFMTQDFQVYFLKDSQNYSENYNNIQQNMDDIQMMHDMRSESDIFQERVEKDLVAFGNFSASDIISHSVFSEEFTQIEPGLFDQEKLKSNNPQNLKEAKKLVQNQMQNQSNKKKQRNSSTNSNIQDDDENYSVYKLPLFNKFRTQQIGVISLKHIRCKSRTSFLDLIAHQMLELVPMVGVDFSMSNLTFDDRKCLHSVNEDNKNEYRDLMQTISKSYKQMSPSTLFYGFGANSVPHITEVSDLFSGTGDLLNPIVMTDHLEQAYYSCLKRVEINLPVHFSQVIQKAIEFAQQSQIFFLNDQENCADNQSLQKNGADGEQKQTERSKSALSYFVLYIFCTGIIDDVQDSIQQLTRVVSLPLSIYIIQIRNENIDKNDIDVSILEKKCQFLFEKGNRKFLRVIQYKDLGFSVGGVSNAMKLLTQHIPFEVEQYFDSVAAHTEIRIQQNEVRKGMDLVREIMRQKDDFLSKIDEMQNQGINISRLQVQQLIQEFKLYEYNTESAEILIGLKKRIERC